MNVCHRRWPWLCLLACLGLGQLHAETTSNDQGADQPVILVTAFAPFADRPVNGSQTVAEWLHGQVIADHRIETLVIPVTWGAPQELLGPAIATHQPIMVLGLGEGHPGRIAIEAVGRNQASGADTNGAQPTSAVLESDGPDIRQARVAFDEAWFSQSIIPVVASDNAGRYLCNSLLYHLLDQPVGMAGFVHIPPQGDTERVVYQAAIAPQIARFILANIRFLEWQRTQGNDTAPAQPQSAP